MLKVFSSPSFRWRVFCPVWVAKWTSFSSTLPTWSHRQRRWFSSVQKVIFSPGKRRILMSASASGRQQRYRGGLGRRRARTRGDRQISARCSSAALHRRVVLPHNHHWERSRWVYSRAVSWYYILIMVQYCIILHFKYSYIRGACTCWLKQLHITLM